MPSSAASTSSAASAHFRIDRRFHIQSWPDRAQALLGWAAHEAIGRDLFELLGCVQRSPGDPVRSWLPSRFLGAKRHRDGSEVPVYVAFEPIREADGGEHGVLLLDRVDTPLLSAPIPEIEAQYRSVFAAMQEGVVVQDRGGQILSCNASAERILGLTADQMRGRSSVDPRWRAVQEDGSPFPGEAHPAMVTLRTGQPCSGVLMGVLKPEGTMAWIRISAQPIRMAPTVPHHAVVATFLDVTEERRLAAEARRRGEQHALVLEGANDGFWEWDVPRGHVSYSPRWASILGHDVVELAPDFSTWEQLTHPDDVPVAMAALQAHFAGDTTFYEAEFRMRSKPGAWVWILARGKVVERDAAGRPLRVAGTHTDVTGRRETELSLRELVRKNDDLVQELRFALDRVKTLAGLLPVCAWCKNVRNDQGYWQRIEEYLSEHTDAKLTHGLCPTCSGRVMP